MSAPRVGIIGARRRRQGLGPYVVRDLLAAGAQVPCFLGTSPDTVQEVRRTLADSVNVAPRGYLDLKAMLAEEVLDALAILSPAESHAAHLESAAAAGLHVLCEKPFVWGGEDPLGTSGALLDRFGDKGLCVLENCQWPHTLSGFEALHPGALETPPRHFEMELEPMTTGLQSLADALPHALSLLQALVPGEDPRVDAPSFSTLAPGAGSLTVRFIYRTASHACDAEVRLQQSASFPRQAAYALDGRRARRVVSTPDYQLSLADSDRTVPIADPLTRLVAEFVAALAEASRGATRPPTRPIRERMQLLVALTAAYAPEEIR
jgi:predicted dehydrogenase